MVVRTQPLSGTYTINRLMGDGNRRFRSLRKFAQTLNCNGVSGPVTVTIDQNTGPYRGAVSFTNVQNPDSFPIVINGNNAIVRPFRGVNRQILSGTFDLTSSCITISNTHHLSFNDLIVDVPEVNTTETIEIRSNASNISFSNVEMINESTDRHVVLLENCKRVVFDSCVFKEGNTGVFNFQIHNSIEDIRILNSTFIDQDKQNINMDGFT